MLPRTALSALIVASLLAPAHAQKPAAAAQPAPRIGLVLSGGGARGSAHVGVLRVLEELRIPVHAIAGTSMGAIVGGLYAYGLSPDEMHALMVRAGTPRDWDDLLRDGVERSERTMRRKQEDRALLAGVTFGLRDGALTIPKGLIAGQNLEVELAWLTREAHSLATFDALPIPFRCTAVDVADGALVVFDRGCLADAMRASMSLPAVFAPARIGGREFLDGGLAANVPIDVARAMGVDVLIVVDIGTPVAKGVQLSGLIEVTGRVMDILTQQNIDISLASLRPGDVLVQPDLGTITSADFDRAVEAIAIGGAAARAMRDTLARFGVSEADYGRFLARQRRTAAPTPVVGTVTVRDETGRYGDLVRTRLRTAPGAPLDEETLRADLDRVHATELFERVGFALRDAGAGAVDVDVAPREKEWGTDTLRLGLSLETDFDSESAFELGAQYTARALNALDAEWRTDVRLGTRNLLGSEFYQPVDAAGRFFTAARGFVGSVPVDVYDRGEKLADADVTSGGGGADVGVTLGDWAELRVGYERSFGSVDFDLASVPVTDFDFDDVVIRTRLDVDSLDDPRFPSRGTAALVEWRSAAEALGADEAYEQLALHAVQPVAFGPTALLGLVRLTTAIDGTLPVERQATIGGFLNLTGLPRGFDRDQHAGVAALVLRHQLSGTKFGFGMPTYLCGSIETGSTWARRSELLEDFLVAGSAFLGVDTPVGPMYVGAGFAESEGASAFFFLGPIL